MAFKGDSLRSSDGSLSAEIMEMGMAKIAAFKDRAETLGAVAHQDLVSIFKCSHKNGNPRWG